MRKVVSLHFCMFTDILCTSSEMVINTSCGNFLKPCIAAGFYCVFAVFQCSKFKDVIILAGVFFVLREIVQTAFMQL